MLKDNHEHFGVFKPFLPTVWYINTSLASYSFCTQQVKCWLHFFVAVKTRKIWKQLQVDFLSFVPQALQLYDTALSIYSYLEDFGFFIKG